MIVSDDAPLVTASSNEELRLRNDDKKRALKEAKATLAERQEDIRTLAPLVEEGRWRPQCLCVDVIPDRLSRLSEITFVDQSRDDALCSDTRCTACPDTAPPGSPAPSVDHCICHVHAGWTGGANAKDGRRAAGSE